MKRVREMLQEIYGVNEAQTLGLMIVPKNEETKAFLESLNKQEAEKPMKLVYYKMRDGKIVAQIWREA